MASGEATKRLAVLIDGDNVPSELADALFAEVAKLGTVMIQRVYARSSGISDWREKANTRGIGLRETMPGKNATDMELAIDAMDLLHRGKLDGFCIVSSDGDFAPLARRLREDGVSVNGFGRANAALGLKGACDSFVALRMPVVDARVEVAAKPNDHRERAKASETKAKTVKGSTVQVGLNATRRKLIERTLTEVANGRSHVPVAELGNHLPKGKKGEGKLKTRLRADGFTLIGKKELKVEVPHTA